VAGTCGYGEGLSSSINVGGNLLTSLLVSFSRRTLLHGVSINTLVMSLVFPAGYFRQSWKQFLLLKMSSTSKWTKSAPKNLAILVHELLFNIKSLHPLVCSVSMFEFSEVLTESSCAKPVPTLLQHLHYFLAVPHQPEVCHMYVHYVLLERSSN